MHAVGGLFWDIDADDVRDYANEINTEVTKFAGSVGNPARLPAIDPNDEVRKQKYNEFLAAWLSFYGWWVKHFDEVNAFWGPAASNTLEMWSRTEQFELEFRALYDRFVSLGGKPEIARPVLGPQKAPSSTYDKLMNLGYVALGLGAVYIIASVLTRMPKRRSA